MEYSSIRCGAHFFLFNFITSLKANKKHTNIKVQRREAIRADKERNASPVAAVNEIGEKKQANL